MTLYNLIGGCKFPEDHAASFFMFKAEGGGSIFLQKHRTYKAKRCYKAEDRNMKKHSCGNPQICQQKNKNFTHQTVSAKGYTTRSYCSLFALLRFRQGFECNASTSTKKDVACFVERIIKDTPFCYKLQEISSPLLRRISPSPYYNLHIMIAMWGYWNRDTIA
jgi:hypothetical protein